MNENPTTVTISNVENLNTNSVPIPLNITFSNNVSGFDTNDFIIENGIISSFTKIDSKNYKAEITPLSQGNLSIQVSEESTLDEDNNQNDASNKLQFTYDIIKPMISGISSDSNANSWWFIVDFNEAVFNVDKTDFELKGAAANSLKISSVDVISNRQYRVNLVNSNSEIGTISLKLNGESDILDNSGNKIILSEYEAYFLNNEVLSIEDLTLEDKVKIYTNHKNNLRFEGLKLSKEKTTIKIYTLLGIEIVKKTFETKVINNIQLPNMSTGVYIIYLKNSNGNINKKIIIK